MIPLTCDQKSVNPANRLGLDYQAQAQQFSYSAPIVDVHTHINTLKCARLFFKVANLFGIEKIWSMTQLEHIDEIKNEFGDRIDFIAVPNFYNKDDPQTFTTDWYKRLEKFAAKGVKIVKFWAAPRSIDFMPSAWLDSPKRLEAMHIAKDLGMMFMTHVGDPDTWFSHQYHDTAKYGTKARHHEILEKMLDQYSDIKWLAAHMAGDPEHLDNVQKLLDKHPNLYIDTAATKWMVRELSKHPGAFADFCRRNKGRVLFGSDIVATDDNMDFDLYASRYWALRTLMETDYDGPSPIVDPDLHMVDSSLPEQSTATLRGAEMDKETLTSLYHDAAHHLYDPLYQP